MDFLRDPSCQHSHNLLFKNTFLSALPAIAPHAYAKKNLDTLIEIFLYSFCTQNMKECAKMCENIFASLRTQDDF